MISQLKYLEKITLGKIIMRCIVKNNRENYSNKYKSSKSTSKDVAINTILSRIKNYIFDKKDRFSEEELTKYINEIGNINTLKHERDRLGLNLITPGYYLQLERLKQMHNSYPKTVFPFLAYDPRRPGIMDIVVKEE